MATISTLLLPEHGSTKRGRAPYMVQKTIDLTAQAIDCSSGDVVQCLTIPANTRVLHAGVCVVASATQNTGTDATVTLGAADADEFVTAFDIDGAADGAYAMVMCMMVHTVVMRMMVHTVVMRMMVHT